MTNQKVVLFGASVYGNIAFELLRNLFPIIAYSDNNSSIHNSFINGVPVIAPDKLSDFCKNNDAVVIITSIHYEDISRQLLSSGVPLFNSQDVLIMNLRQILKKIQEEGSFSPNKTEVRAAFEDNIYSDMQRVFYDNPQIPSQDVIGFFDHNESTPYETLLLYRNGDIRYPIFNNTIDKIALDFGCGPGRMIQRMSKYFQRVDGADISHRLLEEARATCTGSRFYLASGFNVGDAPDSAYDFLYSTITLQHVCVHRIRTSILQDMKRVLKRGGKITIQMAFNENYPYWESVDSFQKEELKFTVHRLDKKHATYFENRTDALVTNGHCDVAIGPADLEHLLNDFKMFFEDVDFWVYDYFINRCALDQFPERLSQSQAYWFKRQLYICGCKN